MRQKNLLFTWEGKNSAYAGWPSSTGRERLAESRFERDCRSPGGAGEHQM